MSILLIGMLIFILVILLLELSFYAVRLIRYPDQSSIRKRLRQDLPEDSAKSRENIFKKQVLSEVPFFNQLLFFIPRVERLNRVIKQANVPYTLGTLILLGVALGLSGFLIGCLLTQNIWHSSVLAIFPTTLPLFYVRSKKKKRMAKFEKQLPDGLGLIARALCAGHSFSSGMKIASEEMEDPLGPEFEETLDEINFGVSVSDALKNLARRVDCPDIRFFVVSVILQRETGGNLAEIIEGLAQLIRDRFKFRQKVMVLSAEGRLSATVLLILPFLLFATLFVVNKDFISPLAMDHIGRLMILIGVALMIMGVIVIKKIINVDV